MENGFLNLLINGYYSDWFLNIFMTNVALAVKNNLALLLLLVGTWAKFSDYTKNKWDNKASNWLMQKLTGFKKGEK